MYIGACAPYSPSSSTVHMQVRTPSKVLSWLTKFPNTLLAPSGHRGLALPSLPNRKGAAPWHTTSTLVQSPVVRFSRPYGEVATRICLLPKLDLARASERFFFFWELGGARDDWRHQKDLSGCTRPARTGWAGDPRSPTAYHLGKPTSCKIPNVTT